MGHLRKNGTENEDYARSAVIAEDGSILVAFRTDGDWDGVNVGRDDFAAVKLDANGTEIWRWQVSQAGLMSSEYILTRLNIFGNDKYIYIYIY